MLSVIIPVKNEPYLPFLLVEINRYVENCEILIQKEKGLGYAVMCGIKRAKGDVIAILDGDGSHGPEYIPLMLNELNRYEIVVGSRYAKGISHDSFSRKVISRIYCKFAQLLFGLNVKDNMSGFIVAKKEVFLRYPIKNKGYKILMELLVQSKGVLKATEVPIVFHKRMMGKSKASLMEAINTLVFMLRLKANLLT